MMCSDLGNVYIEWVMLCAERVQSSSNLISVMIEL